MFEKMLNALSLNDDYDDDDYEDDEIEENQNNFFKKFTKEEEEEECQKVIAEARAKEMLEKEKAAASRLKEKVKGWETVRASSFHYSYLLNYYPTTCEFEATESEWEDRYLVWNFKNTPEKTSASAHESALDNLIPRIQEKLDTTFGCDTEFLTLFCIPASSKEKTQARYEEFSKRLCELTGMHNSYTHVEIGGSRGAKHEGNNTFGDISYNFDGEFFKGKNVLLFDDVITRGESMLTWKSQMEGIGANVIAGLTIGKTTHERPHIALPSENDDLPF